MVWGQPSQPQPPQTCVLPAWGHPKNPEPLNRAVMKRKTKPKKHTRTHEHSRFQPTRWFFCLLSFPAQQALLDWLTAAPGQAWSWCRTGQSLQPPPCPRHSQLWLGQGCTGWGGSRGAPTAAPSSHRLHRASHSPSPLLPPPEQHTTPGQKPGSPGTEQSCARRKLQLPLSAGMGQSRAWLHPSPGHDVLSPLRRPGLLEDTPGHLPKAAPTLCSLPAFQLQLSPTGDATPKTIHQVLKHSALHRKRAA